MKVTKTHHDIAKRSFSNGEKTLAIITSLMGSGLTKAQANAACRTARKQSKLYKNVSKAIKAEARHSKNRKERVVVPVERDDKE